MIMSEKRVGRAFERDQAWLLPILKALADETRLMMLGLLAKQEYKVGDLAARLDLTEPTVSHHLAKLREVGLVTLRAVGTQRIYSVNDTTLKHFKDAVQQIEVLREPTLSQSDESWIDALPEDFGNEERAMLREMTYNGQLRQIPSKQLKLLVALRWLATKFAADVKYTEKEVNAIIQTVYPTDHATLRRDLVDFGFLRRERGGGSYWLAPEEDEDDAPENGGG